MQLSTIFDKTRKITNTNSTTLPDAELLSLTNETYLDIQRSLANEEIELFGTNKKTDLVAGQTNYALPSDLLTILRLEINYDDPTDEDKWKKIDQSDLGNLPYEWYELLKTQPKTKPLMDLFGGQVFIFPRPEEGKANGLRIWYIAKQPEFTSTSDEIPPILDTYYDVFVYGNAFKYLEQIGHSDANRKFELYQFYMKKMLDDLKVEVIEPIKMKAINPFNQGWL
jgi:hypothetical protein